LGLGCPREREILRKGVEIRGVGVSGKIYEQRKGGSLKNGQKRGNSGDLQESTDRREIG